MPPAAKPTTSSPGDRGGISESTMLPCTLAITSEDDVLANAFCVIAIITRPGARNSANEMPPATSTCGPSARTNTARNSSVVTTGAAIVWVWTLVKRRISRIDKVQRPSQLTEP
jgi:hypothetical protein